MLPKRLFLGALLLSVFANINGCPTTTGISEDSYEARYRMASDECIRFGHRRGSYDYKRCIEKRMESVKVNSSSEEK